MSKVRKPFRCRYVRAGKKCERDARENWTTCNAHYTSGMNRSQWARIHGQHKA